MDTKIITRHFELTENTRKRIEQKLKKLEKFDHKILNINLVMDMEGSRRKVEIIVKTKKSILKAKSENHNTLTAFNEAFKKIESQVRKLEDKLSHHNE